MIETLLAEPSQLLYQYDGTGTNEHRATRLAAGGMRVRARGGLEPPASAAAAQLRMHACTEFEVARIRTRTLKLTACADHEII